jgi:hypothetical protein
MTIINKDILGPNVIYKKVKLKGTREVAEIYDNCLDHHVFQDIQNKIFYQNFPWYLEADDRSFHRYHKSPLKNYEVTNHTQLNHLFYHVNDRSEWSNYTPWINPVLNIISPRAWFRVKANYVAASHKPNVSRGWHHDASGDIKNNNYDNPWPECKIAVFYINTNNGYTLLETGDKVESKANRLVIFPNNFLHTAILQTDTPHRILINMVFFPHKEYKKK